MSQLYFDQRWCANHGIGRFATELRRRLVGFADLPLKGSPTSPLDPWKLAGCLGRSETKGFFSPGFNVAAWSRCQVVTTIHDLIHVRFSAESSPLKRAYYRYLQRPVVRRSPVTLTVSEYSRQQIMEWYGIAEDRVVVVGNGVSDDFTHRGEAHRSDKPYFIYVGNTKPHKNVDSLLDAFDMVAEQCDVALKLVTSPNMNLERKIDQLTYGSRIEFKSGVDDSSLAALYRGAVGLVMPSYYEGFGLPLVEAMACGCPVIASNRTSIPEVVGDAGILVDPDDTEQLATAMQGLFKSGEMRQPVVQRCLARAKEFRWSNVAKKVQAALKPITD